MKILHIVDGIGIGGTEVLLKNTLPLLPNYSHIVCYLDVKNIFERDFKGVNFVSLGKFSPFKLIFLLFRLKKLITKESPNLIHAHHFWPNILARIICSKSIKIVSTYHSVLSEDAFLKNKYALWLEKLTSNRSDCIIAVSNAVKNDYLKFIRYNKQFEVIYNFIPEDKKYDLRINSQIKNQYKIVAIGNIKDVKNYDYIIEAFKYLKDVPITLDVFGGGHQLDSFRQQVIECGLKIKFKGIVSDFTHIKSKYNYFLQASKYEGYGIALVEMMFQGLRPILSDIPTHRELASDFAYFFSLGSPKKLADLLIDISMGKTEFQEFNRIDMINHANEISSQYIYIKRLTAIYEQFSRINTAGKLYF